MIKKLRYEISFLHPYRNIITEGLTHIGLTEEDYPKAEPKAFDKIFKTLIDKGIDIWKYVADTNDDTKKLHKQLLNKLIVIPGEGFPQTTKYRYYFKVSSDKQTMRIYRTVFDKKTNTYVQNEDNCIVYTYIQAKTGEFGFSGSLDPVLKDYTIELKEDLFKKITPQPPYFGTVVGAQIKENLNFVATSEIIIDGLLPTLGDLKRIHGAPDLNIYKAKFKQPALTFKIKLFDIEGKVIYCGIIDDVIHTIPNQIRNEHHVRNSKLKVKSLISLLEIPTLREYQKTNSQDSELLPSTIQMILRSFKEYHLYDNKFDVLTCNIDPNIKKNHVNHSNSLLYNEFKPLVLDMFKDAIYRNILTVNLDYERVKIHLEVHPDIKADALRINGKFICKLPTYEEGYKRIQLVYSGQNPEYFVFQNGTFQKVTGTKVADQDYEVSVEIPERHNIIDGFLYHPEYRGVGKRATYTKWDITKPISGYNQPHVTVVDDTQTPNDKIDFENVTFRTWGQQKHTGKTKDDFFDLGNNTFNIPYYSMTFGNLLSDDQTKTQQFTNTPFISLIRVFVTDENDPENVLTLTTKDTASFNQSEIQTARIPIPNAKFGLTEYKYHDYSLPTLSKRKTLKNYNVYSIADIKVPTNTGLGTLNPPTIDSGNVSKLFGTLGNSWQFWASNPDQTKGTMNYPTFSISYTPTFNKLRAIYLKQIELGNQPVYDTALVKHYLIKDVGGILNGVGITLQVVLSNKVPLTLEILEMTLEDIWTKNQRFQRNSPNKSSLVVSGQEIHNFKGLPNEWVQIKFTLEKHNSQTNAITDVSLYSVAYSLTYNGNYHDPKTRVEDISKNDLINPNQLEFNWRYQTDSSKNPIINYDIDDHTIKKYTSEWLKWDFDPSKRPKVASVEYFTFTPKTIEVFDPIGTRLSTHNLKELNIPIPLEIIEKKITQKEYATPNYKYSRVRFIEYVYHNYIKRNLVIQNTYKYQEKDLVLNRHPLNKPNKNWLIDPPNQLILDFEINGTYYQNKKVYTVEKSYEYRKKISNNLKKDLGEKYKAFQEILKVSKEWVSYFAALIDARNWDLGRFKKSPLDELVKGTIRGPDHRGFLQPVVGIGLSKNPLKPPNLKKIREYYDKYKTDETLKGLWENIPGYSYKFNVPFEYYAEWPVKPSNKYGIWVEKSKGVFAKEPWLKGDALTPGFDFVEGAPKVNSVLLGHDGGEWLRVIQSIGNVVVGWTINPLLGIVNAVVSVPILLYEAFKPDLFKETPTEDVLTSFQKDPNEFNKLSPITKSTLFSLAFKGDEKVISYITGTNKNVTSNLWNGFFSHMEAKEYLWWPKNFNWETSVFSKKELPQNEWKTIDPKTTLKNNYDIYYDRLADDAKLIFPDLIKLVATIEILDKLSEPKIENIRTLTTVNKEYEFDKVNFQVIATKLNNGSYWYEFLDEHFTTNFEFLDIEGTQIKRGRTLLEQPRHLIPETIISKERYLLYDKHYIEEFNFGTINKPYKVWQIEQVNTRNNVFIPTENTVIGAIDSIVEEKIQQEPINSQSSKKQYEDALQVQMTEKDFKKYSIGEHRNIFETRPDASVGTTKYDEYGISIFTGYEWKLGQPTISMIFGGYIRSLTDKLKTQELLNPNEPIAIEREVEN